MLLIAQVMRLMGITECIESHMLDEPAARIYLLLAEGMALAEEMLIFAHAMQEDGLPVQIEAMVLVREPAFCSACRPFHLGETDFCLHAVHNLVHTPLHHRRLNRIKLRMLKRPMLQLHVPHRDCQMHNLRQPCTQFDGLLLQPAADLRLDDADFSMIVIVMHLRIHEDRIQCFVGPGMYAKRLHSQHVGHLKADISEKAERCRSFTESPFCRASSAHPGKVGDVRRMVALYLQSIVHLRIVRVEIFRDVEARHNPACRSMIADLASIHLDGHIASRTLQLQRIMLLRSDSCITLLRDSIEGEPALVACLAMKVSMHILPIAVIIVPIVGQLEVLDLQTIGFSFRITHRTPLVIQRIGITSHTGGRHKGAQGY